MRAALSILGLVIVFALVLTQMKKQVLTVSKAPAASAASSAQTAPAAVRQQLQEAARQAAQRASDAQP
ncbi:MAG: hypothetical protein IV107_23005 [Paucibacter sp.]|nr:hypothetical protein [Roseateles sp.]